METQEQNQNEQISKSKISTPAAILTAGALIAAALFFSGNFGGGSVKQKSVSKNQVPEVTAPVQNIEVTENDRVYGDLKNAEVVIVEYSDSDCPFCQRFHNTMKEIVSKYQGKVAWVYRYFPLSMHANANNEAIALECSANLGGNEVFWKYLDEVIEITVTPEKSANILTSTAKSLGINEKDFAKCLSNKEVQDKVLAQSQEAQSLGAKGTPFSVAISKSGKQLAIPGAYPTEEIVKIIDGLLK